MTPARVLRSRARFRARVRRPVPPSQGGIPAFRHAGTERGGEGLTPRSAPSALSTSAAGRPWVRWSALCRDTVPVMSSRRRRLLSGFPDTSPCCAVARSCNRRRPECRDPRSTAGNTCVAAASRGALKPPGKGSAPRRSTEIPDPGHHLAGLPLSLREFVLTACRRGPAASYANAAAALAALDAATAGCGIEIELGGGRLQRLETPLAAAGVRSHAGRVRSTNQDRFWLSERSDGSVFLAVADGLGGDPFSEIAADMVISSLAEAGALPPGDEARTLADLALGIDRRIEACARRCQRKHGRPLP